MVVHALAEDDEVGRYRLDVIAVDVEDAVRFAGGLICDRSLAGWDVRVLSGAGESGDALRILGAEMVDDLPTPIAAPRQTLAVSAAAIAADDSVRDRVLDTLAAGATDVLVWDAQRAVTVPAVFETVEHDVSAAARAYRRHALRTLGLASDGDSEATAAEVFSRPSGRPVAAPGVPEFHRLGHGG